jgi:hypothetical protein
MEKREMLAIPDITGVDVAFGNIKHMPKYETVPEEFKNLFSSNEYCRAVSKWFFEGAKAAPNGIQVGSSIFSAKRGVDKSKALAAIRAVLGSFEPKHEHKHAACAFMLSEWFDVSKAEAS